MGRSTRVLDTPGSHRAWVLRAVARRAVAVFVAITVPLFVATSVRAQQSAPVDRIVAVVDGEVITLGQLDRAVSLAQTATTVATEGCTAPAGAAGTPEASVLECMIDDLLRFQHVRRFPQFDVLPEDIDAAYERQVAQFESRQAFEESLRRQRKTPTEVRYDLQREALVANYITVRYRDVVDIRETEVRRYYDEVLRLEMEREGAELPPFEAVDDEWIRPLLFETDVNRRVDEWTADLRRRAEIVIYLW